MLSRLSDMNFVQDLCEDLYEMFKVQVMSTPPPPVSACLRSPANSRCSCPLQTDKGFDKTMFERQMSVMRGQVSFSAFSRHFLRLSSQFFLSSVPHFHCLLCKPVTTHFNLISHLPPCCFLSLDMCCFRFGRCFRSPTV